MFPIVLSRSIDCLCSQRLFVKPTSKLPFYSFLFSVWPMSCVLFGYFPGVLLFLPLRRSGGSSLEFELNHFLRPSISHRLPCNITCSTRWFKSIKTVASSSPNFHSTVGDPVSSFVHWRLLLQARNNYHGIFHTFTSEHSTQGIITILASFYYLWSSQQSLHQLHHHLPSSLPRSAPFVLSLFSQQPSEPQSF